MGNTVDTHGSKGKGWIGVDLDGTLAHYDGWKGEEHIGKPIPAMVDRVKQWLNEGKDVRILTARVAHQRGTGSRRRSITAIYNWLEEHIGQKLQLTNSKDHEMIELWDDRAVQVKPNTGQRADGLKKSMEKNMSGKFKMKLVTEKSEKPEIDEQEKEELKEQKKEPPSMVPGIKSDCEDDLEDLKKEKKLEKAGPYIGPQGGKYKDAQRKIPWKEEYGEEHSKPSNKYQAAHDKALKKLQDVWGPTALDINPDKISDPKIRKVFETAHQKYWDAKNDLMDYQTEQQEKKDAKAREARKKQLGSFNTKIEKDFKKMKEAHLAKWGDVMIDELPPEKKKEWESDFRKIKMRQEAIIELQAAGNKAKKSMEPGMSGIEELEQFAKAGPHKYISRKKVKGNWVYEYPEDKKKKKGHIRAKADETVEKLNSKLKESGLSGTAHVDYLYGRMGNIRIESASGTTAANIMIDDGVFKIPRKVKEQYGAESKFVRVLKEVVKPSEDRKVQQTEGGEFKDFGEPFGVGAELKLNGHPAKVKKIVETTDTPGNKEYEVTLSQKNKPDITARLNSEGHWTYARDWKEFKDLWHHKDTGKEAIKIKHEVMKKSEVAMSGIEELESFVKGGPYIGPRGGKWADPDHKIPWAESEKKRAKGKTAKEWPTLKDDRVDSHAVRELELYADNDHDLYRQKEAFHSNVVKKMAAGKYDHAQAPQLWSYYADRVAAKYTKEFGGNFDKPTRQALAHEMANDFHDEVKQNPDDYEKFVPKKYKKDWGKKEGTGPKDVMTSMPILSQMNTIKRDPAELSMGDKADLKSVGFLKVNKNGNSVLTKQGKYVKETMQPVAYAAARRTVARLQNNKIDMAEVSSDIKTDLRGMGWAKTDKNGNTVLTKQGKASMKITGAPKIEKSEVNMSGIEELEEFTKSSGAGGMPTGKPRIGGTGGEQGGPLAGKGKTSGSGDSSSGEPIGAPKPKKDKLSEDDAEDEKQMKPHKKPIEKMAKSDDDLPIQKSDTSPQGQRDMVAHRTAQVVSKIRKGEEDIQGYAVGVAPPPAPKEEMVKGKEWNQGPDSFVNYSNQADLEIEKLFKSDDFYTNGSPTIGMQPLLKQQKTCPSCKSMMNKSLSACPSCGFGTVEHRVVPVKEQSTEMQKSTRGPLLKPRVEKDLYLPNGVDNSEEE